MVRVSAVRAFSAGVISVLWLAPAAHAEAPAIEWGLAYKGDVTGVVSGGASQAGRYLDNIDLTADVSLERALGWRGAHLYAHLLSNAGGAPNDIAGTLQGVDNIEVARPRAKLYQFWLEQNFAGERGSALVGLYDLNSEFYQSESAGLLIAPAFGIGSELAATGPNGPSIFPSTALALRVRWSLNDAQRVQAAVINASAGVVGDPSGVDTSFDNGALLIAEWARGGDLQFKLGAWRYSKAQDDIRDVDALGAPVRRDAQGAYASIEAPLWGGEGSPAVAAFARVGVADGDTTPYRGGWQAGVLVTHLFDARPDSAFSLGLNQGFLDAKFRANARDGGVEAAAAESALELTYADRLGAHLTLQPDLQLVHNPAADRARSDVVVAALRVGLEF
ncbi:MAG TPA: carbohydrate porin [Caulobacterales bacterium]|nr:carbohydrate porin [Caulobacterales bacterium]